MAYGSDLPKASINGTNGVNGVNGHEEDERPLPFPTQVIQYYSPVRLGLTLSLRLGLASITTRMHTSSSPDHFESYAVGSS